MLLYARISRKAAGDAAVGQATWDLEELTSPPRWDTGEIPRTATGEGETPAHVGRRSRSHQLSTRP